MGAHGLIVLNEVASLKVGTVGLVGVIDTDGVDGGGVLGRR